MPSDGTGFDMEDSPWEKEDYITLIVIFLYLHWEYDENSPEDQLDWRKHFELLHRFFLEHEKKRFSKVSIKDAWVEINRDYFRTDRGTNAWRAQAIDPFADIEPLLRQYTLPLKEEGSLPLETRIRSTQKDWELWWNARGHRIRLSDQEMADDNRLHREMLDATMRLEGFNLAKRRDDFPREWTNPVDWLLHNPNLGDG
ncbi:MAG: hypothetical protein Q9174_004773 [Haloplaca sp. 1 TL-2023]